MRNIHRFRVEPYYIASGRCWGCSQENCSNCSCSCHTSTEKKYQIVRDDGVIVELGHFSPLSLEELHAYLNKKFNLNNVKKKFTDRRKELRASLNKLKLEELKEIERIKQLRGY